MMYAALFLTWTTMAGNEIDGCRAFMRGELSIARLADEFGILDWHGPKNNRRRRSSSASHAAYVARLSESPEDLRRDIKAAFGRSREAVQTTRVLANSMEFKSSSWWVYAGVGNNVGPLTNHDCAAMFEGVMPAVSTAQLLSRLQKLRASNAGSTPHAGETAGSGGRYWTLVVARNPHARTRLGPVIAPTRTWFLPGVPASWPPNRVAVIDGWPGRALLHHEF